MGNETSKSHSRRNNNGDYNRYFRGVGIDIGGGRDPLPGAMEHDRILGNDAHDLSMFADGYLDYVYSSHCLEHLEHPVKALSEWWRVLKPGGYLCVVVPSWILYEKRHSPSRFNTDHKHFYTINSLLRIVQDLFHKDCQVIRLQINDEGYDYTDKISDQTTKGAQAEIELIVKKVTDRFWADMYEGDNNATSTDKGRTP